MTPQELRDNISTLSAEQLIEFLQLNNDIIRLTFIQAAPNAENDLIFRGVSSDLSRLQLTESVISRVELQSLYTHLAFFFKKRNDRAFVDSSATHIRESIFKKRLSAWLHYRRYDKHASNVTEFENYLAKLSEARYEADEDYTYEILSDLYEYRNKTIPILSEPSRSKMISLFESEELAERYPILKQLQKDSLDQLPNVEVVEYTAKEYIPSTFAEEVFKRNFITYIKSKNLFGYTVYEVTEDIIKKGQADFDEDFKEISAVDVVKLYCYFNMRMHYFSSLNLYERSELVPQFYKTHGRIKFIDIGCGPATCGLAFTDYIFEATGYQASFDYFGIDSSITMHAQARDIMNNTAFLSANIQEYYTNTSEINLDSLNNASCIIINTCYVFASDSLPIEQLSDFVKELNVKYKYVPKYLLFQNPVGPFLNKNYLKFKELLLVYDSQFEENRKISYFNQRIRWDKPKEKTISYEILKL